MFNIGSYIEKYEMKQIFGDLRKIYILIVYVLFLTLYFVFCFHYYLTT